MAELYVSFSYHRGIVNRLFIHWRRILLIIGGIIVLAFAASMKRDIALHQYYAWRMKQSFYEVSRKDPSGAVAWKNIVRNPQGRNPIKSLQQYEFYRNKLVEGGWLKKETFVLQHITVPSEDSKQLWAILRRTFPQNITLTMMGYETNSLDCITVWDAPHQLDKWNRVISYYDQANAHELLRAASKGSRQNE